MYSIPGVPASEHRVNVRYVGYAQASKMVMVEDGRTATADFTLSRVATALEAVVTTVTGEQRRREVGNVIGTVAADSIVRAGSITAVTDLVMARVPGVQVILNAGFTGSTPSVRVRGISSISLSNDPLLIIDGVRVANTWVTTAGVQAGFGLASGRFNDINPEEIASIDIVKGPSAATLYGTDAANGVIVIKTKRGIGSAARWTGFGEVGTIRPGVDFRPNYYSWGHTPAGVVRQCTLDLLAQGVCVVDSLTTFNALTNPVTSPFGTGRRRAIGAQVAGSASRITYFFSGSTDYEQSYLRLPAAEETRIKVERGGADLPDWQKRPNWLQNTRLRGNFEVPLTPNAEITLLSGLVLNETSIPATTIFGNGEFGTGYRDALDGWRSARPGEVFAIKNQENVSHFTVALGGQWRPASWLSTRATQGIDVSSDFLDALQRANEGPAAGRAGRRQNTESGLRHYSTDLGATASLTPRDQWTSRTSVGVQYNRKKDRLTSVSATTLPPGSETVTGAGVFTGSERNIESVVAGAYVEQQLGWQDRLFLTGALRTDGGSSFGRDFKIATYPKVGLSWIAIPNRQGWLGNLRLRTAYGASGVQPGSTAALTLDQAISVLVEGSSRSGAVPSTIGNPTLKPERSTELEAGFDGELLRDHVNVEATYYSRKTRDALIQYLLPLEVGVTSQWRNIGSVLNEGIEGLLRLRLLDRPELGLNLLLNGSVNNNKVKALGFDQPLIQSAGLHVPGYPVFSRFYRPILSYADANGNGIIEESEITVGPNPVFAGPAVPKSQLSTTPQVVLFNGRVTVSSQFDHRGGFVQTNVNELNRCSTGINNCRAANDPKASFADQVRRIAFNSARFGSTRWGFEEDGSFTRWRELAVSVDIPQRYVSMLQARSAMLTVAGRNLKLWTKYSGYDPEINQQAGFPPPFAGAVYEGFGGDNPTAPQSRYWMLRFVLGL
jgi:TonB-dependent SusC/RagA subfamily outer membrane receptor